LRSLQGNLILIPNSKMVDAIVTNFTYPHTRMSHRIDFAVGFATDIEKLDRVVLEEVDAVAKDLPILLKDPAPALRLSGYGDTGLNFTLYFWVADYEQQGPVADALRRRLLTRFRIEGIVIPTPIRTIRQEPRE